MLLDVVETETPGIGPFYSDLFRVDIQANEYASYEIVLKSRELTYYLIRDPV
jgi:hypothetical protein